MRRVILSVTIILLTAAGAISMSQAFFSDTETSSGNVLAAGAIDLKIDNESYYNGILWDDTTFGPSDLEDHLFLNFTDLKPDDWGEDTISIHIDDNEAWACVDVALTSNDDNDCTEPELGDDPSCTENDDPNDGELAQHVEFIFWIDDGDNVLEDDEFSNNVLTQGSALNALSDQSWVLADSGQNNVGGALGEGLDPLETYYIGKAWCFGTLTPEPLTQDNASDLISPADTTGGIACDGTLLTNETQTDSLTADFSFRAEQHRHNASFLCTPEECHEEVFAFAAFLEETSQGTLKNGSPITNPNRADPNEAVGAPDWAPGTGTNFYSIGLGGFITLEFADFVADGEGVDISIHEATNGRNTYPLERAEVFVSADGTTFHSIGFVTSEPGGDGVSYLDISNNASAPALVKYVKVADATDFGPHNSTADGFDLDAVDAVYGQCTEQTDQF